MEQLWNREGANGGKRSARRKGENSLNYRQTVATGCHQLPFGSHGKEGVSGSSPEEGSHKSPANGVFVFPTAVQFVQRARVRNRLWNSQAKKALTLLSDQASDAP